MPNTTTAPIHLREHIFNMPNDIRVNFAVAFLRIVTHYLMFRCPRNLRTIKNLSKTMFKLAYSSFKTKSSPYYSIVTKKSIEKCLYHWMLLGQPFDISIFASADSLSKSKERESPKCNLANDEIFGWWITVYLEAVKKYVSTVQNITSKKEHYDRVVAGIPLVVDDLTKIISAGYVIYEGETPYTLYYSYFSIGNRCLKKKICFHAFGCFFLPYAKFNNPTYSPLNYC